MLTKISKVYVHYAPIIYFQVRSAGWLLPQMATCIVTCARIAVLL